MFNRKADNIDDVEEYLKSRKTSDRESKFKRDKVDFDREEVKDREAVQDRHTETYKRTENYEKDNDGLKVTAKGIAESIESGADIALKNGRVLRNGKVYGPNGEIKDAARLAPFRKENTIDTLAYVSLSMAFASMFMQIVSLPTFILSLVCLCSKRKNNKVAVNICAGISLVVSLFILIICIIIIVAFAGLLVGASYNWN